MTAGTVLFIENASVITAPAWLWPVFVAGLLAVGALLTGWYRSGR